jgi:autotransporter-associated beta strand repeat
MRIQINKKFARSAATVAAAAAMLAGIHNAGAADTPVSSWSGSAGSDWNDAANWSDGAPSAAMGAVFDSSFANMPSLPAAGTAGVTANGVWFKNGVGGDVEINSAGPVRLIGTAAATLNNLPNAFIVMDDPANRNVTFGPDITLWPEAGSRIYINNGGTLTIAGGIRNTGGAGNYVSGTNSAATVRLSGKLVPGGGSPIQFSFPGHVFFDSPSPDYSNGIDLRSGVRAVLKFTNTMQSVSSCVMWDLGTTMMFRSDEAGARFIIGANGLQYNGGNAIVDVDRLDPQNGAAANNTIKLNAARPGNGSKLSVTGGSGYGLDIEQITAGNGNESTIHFMPLSAPLRIGGLTSQNMGNGKQSFEFSGTNVESVIYGSVRNAPGGAFGVEIIKTGASAWRFEGDNSYTRATSVRGGRLTAAHGNALGFGGEARRTEAGGVSVDGAGVALEITGAAVNKPVVLSNTAALLNDQPGTLGILASGVSHIVFSDYGSGYALEDLGKPLTISGGGGAGAGARIAALCASSNTITASGGAGWATGNTITLTGGGATANATFRVTADENGAIVGLDFNGSSNVDFNRGYGYTSMPTGHVKTGSGTGETIVFNDNFSIAAIAMTAPGSGYASAPAAAIENTSGAGCVPTAVISALSATSNSKFPLGGEGDLRIDARINTLGNNGIAKVGAGALMLSGSNSFEGMITIEAGALSAINTAGSATGKSLITVNDGGALAGNGFIVTDDVNKPNQITIKSGGKIAPHIGTEQDAATLSANVARRSNLDAMLVESGAIFAPAIGASGADLLRVKGNLTMREGAYTLQPAPKNGMRPGRYTILEVEDGVFTRSDANVWNIESDPNWQYKVIETESGIDINVVPAATLMIVR